MDYNKNFNLQLFGKVSNPYEFNIDGNYIVNADITSNLVDLSYYARYNIENYKTITEIPQENLDYLNSGLHASNMDHMFDGCKKLTTIPNLNIDTSNVTDMEYMFDYCNALTSIDVSYFDTSKVTDMEYMFYGCSSLASLDLSNFDTSKVTNMEYMFDNCNSLTSLNISNFDTSNVISMYAMFRNLNSLTSLNISNFDTSKVTNMTYMFNGCSNLSNINCIINMKSCTRYNGMFSFCSKLTGVKIKNPPAGFNGAGLNSSQYEIVS